MLWKETMFTLGFGFWKIPLIFFCRPTVEELTDRRCVVRIPLSRRTKNHLGSMYFGALAIGADLAGGMAAMRYIEQQKAPVSLVFKDFKAEFLKRPEGDVHFICEDGEAISALVKKAMESGERENLSVRITAKVPTQSDEPVAVMDLTLSLKRKGAGGSGK